jgi:predicted sugar kinase
MTEDISALLTKWAAAKLLQTVAFEEVNSPSYDTLDDYSVKYEARFKPSHPEHGEVGIMLTSNDFIGIGFETRANIARRLNVKNTRQGYAAGFEPCEKSGEQLLLFLDLVREGKIAILARCWPLVGLGSTHAVALERNLSSNLVFGPRGWLKAIEDTASTITARVLPYEAWT